MESTASSSSNPRGTIRILKCHSSLFCADKLVILIVCDQTVERQELAKALVNIKKPFKLDVHITRSLPLKFKNSSEANVDFVVFMIDASRRSSKQNIEESVKFVDIDYFQGKSCFVAINCTVPLLTSCDVNEISELEDIYKIPLLHTDFSDEKQKDYLAQQILSQAEIASGMMGNSLPSFLEAASGIY